MVIEKSSVCDVLLAKYTVLRKRLSVFLCTINKSP